MTKEEEKHQQSLAAMGVAIKKLEAEFMSRADSDDDHSRRMKSDYNSLIVANAQKDEKIQALEKTIKRYEESISTEESDLQDLKVRFTEQVEETKATNTNLEKLQKETDRVLHELEEYKSREEIGKRDIDLIQPTSPRTQNLEVATSEEHQEK